MRIKPTISFDLDGTLIYQDQNRKLRELIKITEGCGYRVSAESLRTAKEIANQFYDVVAHRFSGKTTELWYHYAEVMTIYLGIMDKRLIKEIADYLQSYGHDARNFYTALDARQMLETLHQQDIRLYIVSNNLQAEERSAMVGIREYFQAVYSTSNGVSKGDLFGILLKEQEIDGQNLLHVGNDLLSDYFVPTLLGVRTILFVTEENLQPYSSKQLISARSYFALSELIQNEVVKTG